MKQTRGVSREGLQQDLRSLAREVAFHKAAFEDTIRRAARVKFELKEKKGF